MDDDIPRGDIPSLPARPDAFDDVVRRAKSRRQRTAAVVEKRFPAFARPASVGEEVG